MEMLIIYIISLTSTCSLTQTQKFVHLGNGSSSTRVTIESDFAPVVGHVIHSIDCNSSPPKLTPYDIRSPGQTTVYIDNEVCAVTATSLGVPPSGCEPLNNVGPNVEEFEVKFDDLFDHCSVSPKWVTVKICTVTNLTLHELKFSLMMFFLLRSSGTTDKSVNWFWQYTTKVWYL